MLVVGVDIVGFVCQIVEWVDFKVVVLVLEMVVEIYGLDILCWDVEDEVYNIMCFVILLWDKMKVVCNGQLVIIMFIFWVCNVFVVFYKVFGGFVINGVNMIKLEFYQFEGQFFVLMFYVDIEGYLEDLVVVLVLEEFVFFCVELKIVGVYRVSLFCDKICELEVN